MYNKESLKQRRLNTVAAILTSTILAAGVMIGCGSMTNDPGGGTTATLDASTEEAGTKSEVSEIKIDDIEPLAIDIAEPEDIVDNILSREKPVLYDRDGKEHPPMSSNAFIMINEVFDPGEKRNTVRVKGTLYEVFLDGEPDYDLVYFPGDDLPEGYEVKVTEDYEVGLRDDICRSSNAFLPKEDAFHKVSYKCYLGCCIITQDIDPSVSLEDSDWEGVALEPGMYGSLAVEPIPYVDSLSAEFVQYLLKDQVPEGIEMDDNIVHQ